MLPHTISMWLPCALRVEPWPAPHLTQFEWYVPIDGERHIYWNFVSSSKERIELAKQDWRQDRFAHVPGETEFIPLPE